MATMTETPPFPLREDLLRLALTWEQVAELLDLTGREPVTAKTLRECARQLKERL